MADIIITRDDICKAKDYLPLAHKDTMARLMATLCIEEIPNPNSTAVQPLPNLTRENRRMRQQCLMGVFVQWYLGKAEELQVAEYTNREGKSEEKPINYCLSVEATDRWAGSHVFNQMDRWKKARADVSDKAYAIMYDYKAFENMLLGAISDELKARNDPALRMVQLMNIQTSPESLRETIKILEEAKEVMGRE